MLCKILGGVLVISGSTGISFFYCGQARERYSIFQELKKVLILLKGEIRYSRAVLPEAMWYLSQNTISPLSQLFASTAEELEKRQGKSLSVIWEENCRKYLKRCGMQKSDRELIGEIGAHLSLSDGELIIQTLDLTIERIQQILADDGKKLEEKIRIYRTVGISLGIMAVTIFA